ncbi:MAG: bifunctional DNA-formamidopyrimidine glycosylase/DNA-(apurinic or apyrimidinic site) lyase [Phycisphaerales bacterium]|jgi:formamidopyrimidine-DNA glycosylase|nr:bifunctional DNA-formamidopyrimidine glycosylase/DNA-(apurinic or apyrimidinic site) lyase [Phycisphaerales bacterium]
MPELPEVQTVVNTLQPHAVGHKIVRVDLRRMDILTPHGLDLSAQLTGRTIQSITRRGKRIVFLLNTGRRFYIHLGMSGQLTLHPPANPIPPHTHLILHLTDDTHLRFRDPRRFGGIVWLGDHPPDDNMGPEPLTMRAIQLAKLLSKSRRPIKSALLDQSLIAGLGNIYVDESLFLARIHPQTDACDLSTTQIAQLNRSIKSTLRRAIQLGGSSLRDYRDANGQPGGFQHRHRVYHRDGQPCSRCRQTIEKTILAGRSTHFCPKCQPL